MNKVILCGRITKDIELRKLNNNDSVISLTLAVDRGYKVNDQKVTDFISCVAYKHNADYLYRYAQKGSLVLAEGIWATRSYENRQGEKVYVNEMSIANVSILDKFKEYNNPKPPKQEDVQLELNTGYVGQSKDIVIDTDELPFY